MNSVMREAQENYSPRCGTEGRRVVISLLFCLEIIICVRILVTAERVPSRTQKMSLM